MTDINHEALFKYQQNHKPKEVIPGELTLVNEVKNSKQVTADALWDRVLEQSQHATRIISRD